MVGVSQSPHRSNMIKHDLCLEPEVVAPSRSMPLISINRRKKRRCIRSVRPSAAGNPIVARSNTAKNHETKLWFLSPKIVKIKKIIQYL